MPILDNNGDSKSNVHISVGSARYVIIRHGQSYTQSFCYDIYGNLILGSGTDLPVTQWADGGELPVEASGGTSDPVSSYDVAIILLYGQSLAIGSDSDTQSAPIHGSGHADVIDLTNDTYMFNQGIRPRDPSDPASTLLPMANIASATLVTPAYETSTTSSNFTEVGMHSMAKKLIDAGAFEDVLVVAPGHGAQAWSERTGVGTDSDNLEPGTRLWCNFASCARKAYELAQAEFPGKTIGFPYVLWNQLEAESVEAGEGETLAQTRTRIAENIQQLVDGVTLTARWITGDSDASPKVAIWTKPLSGGADQSGKELQRNLAQAQTEAILTVPRAIAIDDEYVSGNFTDGTHKTATGYSLNGELAGNALLRDFNSEDTNPLHVTSISFDSSSQITLTTDASADGLTEDTTTVPSVTNMGVEVWSNNDLTQRTLTDVSLSGGNIVIQSSAAFSSNDQVRYALKQRVINANPDGGNIREAKTTRPRWLASFNIRDISTYSVPTANTDPSNIAAHSNKGVSPNPRVIPTYSHSLTTNQQTIADSPYLRTWYRADVSLEDGGNSQTHCFGKTGANWALPTAGLTRETISSREYIKGFTATEHVNGPQIVPVDGGPIVIVINAVQAHSATARRVLGTTANGTSNLEWAFDLVTRKARYHVDSGTNSFSGTGSAPQSADDGAGHLHWITIDPRLTNDADIVKVRVDDGSWTSVGPMSNAENRVINHTLRIGNGAGAFPATDTKVSDVMIFAGVLGDSSDFDTVETAILTEFGF